MSIANCPLGAACGGRHCRLPIGGLRAGETLPITNCRSATVLARNWLGSQGSRGRSPSRARILARFIVGLWGRARCFNNNTITERK
jgi:hypothetical protein